MVDRHTPQHKVKESASLNEAIPLRDTDWSLCCLCQTSGGNTTCPATNGYPESYNTIANNVIALDKINQLPFPIDIRRLDNGSGIAASLLENKAIIHKACRIKTDDERVRRAQTRAAKTDNSNEVTSSPTKTRCTTDAKFGRNLPECLLCPSCKKYSGKADDEWKEKIQKDKLIKASTYDIDITFRNDPVLSAKLATALDIYI